MSRPFLLPVLHYFYQCVGHHVARIMSATTAKLSHSLLTTTWASSKASLSSGDSTSNCVSLAESVLTGTYVYTLASVLTTVLTFFYTCLSVSVWSCVSVCKPVTQCPVQPLCLSLNSCIVIFTTSTTGSELLNVYPVPKSWLVFGNLCLPPASLASDQVYRRTTYYCTDASL